MFNSSSLNDAADQTWQEISSHVTALADRVQTDIRPREFHAELIERLVQALAADGGAVWLVPRQQAPVLDQSWRLDQASVTPEMAHSAPHVELVTRVAWGGPATAESTGAGASHPIIAHPFPGAALWSVFPIDEQTRGVVEIFHDADRSPTALQGSRELLSVMCELAADFHRHRELRQLRRHSRQRQELDDFTRQMLQDLERDRVAYTLANEGRRMIDCDRVTVFTTRGSQCRVRCVSGVDTIDRRSSVVRAGELLAASVQRQGQPLWVGEQLDAAPLALQEIVSQYLQESGATLLGVVPLRCRLLDGGERPAGVLFVEQFGDHGPKWSLAECQVLTDAIVERSAAVLGHANRISELPLLWLSRRVATLQTWLLSRRSIVAGVLLLVIGAILLMPADFDIAVRGELQPRQREALFAPSDGTVLGFPALAQVDERSNSRDGYQVHAGDVVIELENPALDYELTTVLGTKATTEQQLDTITVTLERISRSNSLNDQAQFNELTAKKLELEVLRESLATRLDILRSQKADLQVRTTRDGLVETWDVVTQLQSRPVRQGQRLLNIIDVTGPWELQLYVPDHHIGYVIEAQQHLSDDLPVTFLQKSNPQQVHHGHVQQIALATDVHEDHGPSVLVTVAIDDVAQVQPLRPGASVMAQVHCGRRPLAYVWLYDLYESLRTRLLL